MKKLEGKVALITGGNSGIGLGTAKLLATHGAQVVITGRNETTLESARQAIGGDTVALAADVSTVAEIEAAAQKIRDAVGHIDILFANAGVGALTPLGATSEETFDHLFDTNVKGVFFTVQHALPLMNDGGAIVLCASISALMGQPALSVYAATKAAVRSFARGFSRDLLPRRIRVNSLSPGPITSQFFDRMDLPADETEQIRENIRQQVPMQRWGSSEDIARGVLYLSSDDSGFVTGTDLVIDGGWTQL